MTKTLDELVGLIDRFARLHADAREARMEGNIGFQMADDAKLAKAIVEAALRELIAERAQTDHVSEAASWAEITTDQLQLLPRQLLDVACRVRVNEPSIIDDALIDTAAHALNGFLRQYTAEAKAATAIADAQRTKASE